MSNPSLKNSVRLALATATTASLSQFHMQTAMAQEQGAEASDSMEEVIVTGSRVRRLDTESASPIITIDQAAIEKSGVTTAGDLLQRLPTVSGAATNPAVNNGGGFGESNVELRGLDAKRTLVLLNGRRLGLVGASDATDINLIPVNLIERVDVLKEGAGAIYGSDAIAGVVNFITRKDIDGAELSGSYGQTGESDGETQNVNLLWGTSGDNYRFSINGNYNNTEGVSAGAREFSREAIYFYSGSIFPGGSSRVPTGRFYVPAGSGFPANVANCASVTRVAGSSGTNLATDYRCYTPADAYNYQPFNLIMTPQERGSIFANFEYDVNEAVQLYSEVLYSRTSSGFQIAPLPFDAVADDVVISGQSYYNPFRTDTNNDGVVNTLDDGQDFGGADGANPNLTVRLEALGNRRSKTASDSKVAKLGARGGLFGSEWNYDFMVGYSRLDQTASVSGYLYQPGLAGAFGPSFLNAQNVVQCGTAANPIPLGQCTPVNIFNLADESQVTALSTITSGYDTDRIFTSKQASLAFDGKIFSMPAGDALMSVQADYLDLRGDFNVDFIVTATPPLYLNCYLAQETCTGPNSGGYDVRELSAEVFLPLLKDKPGVQALNLTVGSRFSDYSLFGNTTNSTVKLEYRPVNDVLLSGTFAEVFRAPTILDLYASPTNNSSTFDDPCVGLDPTDLAANPNLALACVGVPTDGSFSQPNGQVTGLLTSSEDLDPETGEVVTFGITWQPGFLNNNFSIRADYWKYEIEGVITQLDTNYSMDQCVATGDPNYCGLVTRFGANTANAGLISVFLQPTRNLGTLTTDGVDVGARYTWRETPAGDFSFQIDWTRINSYENAAPNAPVLEVVGTYDRQFGNYAKNRAVGSIGWSMGAFDSQLSARFIDRIQLNEPSGGAVEPEDNPAWLVGSRTYVDLYFGYRVNDNLKVSLNGTNLLDKQPPMLFQNNVTNANTDVQTYDTLGRRYAVSATYKF
jgi:iron complex outermembrane recepter protein